MTRRIFCKVLLVVVAVFGLLVLSGVLLAQGRSEDAFERVKYVQERNTDRLMAMNGVEGTAIGYNQNDRLAVKVFTAGPGVRGIPKELDGVPVQVVVTGKIYALADPTARFPRPVPIGVSTGHPDITAGTIGCRVTNDNGDVYALSNNHVYANENEASIDDDNVLQPGAYDGGTEGPNLDIIDGDEIGVLADFEPIVFHPRANNTIDAAIALSDTDNLGNATPSDGYGIPSSSTAEATLDLLVKKYGRTTGQTNGMITGINATVKVGYSRGTARFVGQIIIESTEGDEFSAGGDSGSLIVTQEGNNPVGLLFAGNSTVTVANQIQPVLDRFGVTVDGSPEGPVDNPPVADFMGSPTSGDAPLIVNFTDLSSGNPTSWLWNFGDGGISTDQNPLYTYDTPGTYTVTLTATNAYGSDSETKVDYITVSEAQAGDVVTITKAEYKLRNGELNVEATSTGSPGAVLTVYGSYDNYTQPYGQMTYDSRKGKYKLKIKSVVDPQVSVKVVSSLGGSATKAVKYK